MKEKRPRSPKRKEGRLDFLLALTSKALQGNTGPPVTRATAKMRRIAAKNIVTAYYHRKPVAWTNIWFPTELLHALDILPFATDVASSHLAMSEVAPDALLRAEESGYPIDSCSFLRAAMGGVLAKFFPKPDVILCTSHLCESGPKAAEAMSRLSGAPSFMLDIPVEDPPAALDYVAEQLDDTAHALASTLGRKFDVERLRQAIVLSNQAQTLAGEVAQMRKVQPCPVRGREMIDYIYMLVMTLGSPDAVEVYKLLKDEMAERVAHGSGAGFSERARLMWLHLRPYFPNDLMEFIENQRGAAIVCDDFTCRPFDPMDSENPFRGLATKLLRNPLAGGAAKRVAFIRQMAEEYRVDGVIQFAHWGCRWNNAEARIIRDALREHGLPFLSLDGDCVDARNLPMGQAKTRIEGFLEMIFSR